MSARKFFEDVRAAARDAEECRRQLECLEGRAHALGRPSFEPHARSTGEPDVMAKRVAMYVDAERRLERRMEEDYETVAAASRVLFGCEEDGRGGLQAVMGWPYADLMYVFYCDDQLWTSVARLFCRSVRTCQNMRDAALGAIDDHGLLALADVRLG